MNEREWIIAANEIADIVFTEVKRVWPDLHPVFDLRYGIADAVLAAGYHKPERGVWPVRLAEAWDEGHEQGYDSGLYAYEDDEPETVETRSSEMNPYREAPPAQAARDEWQRLVHSEPDVEGNDRG